MILRQKNEPDPVLPHLRQGNPKGGALFNEKFMRDLNQQAGAVPGQRIAAASPPVAEVFDDLNALFNNGVRLLALHIDHEAHAAGVFFVLRVIKTLFRWISAHSLYWVRESFDSLQRGGFTL